MAKTDWKKLEQKFQRAHARTGIKLQDWCKQNGISYDTARRYIKLRKNEQGAAQKNAQKNEHKNAQNSEQFSDEKSSFDEAYDEDGGAKNSEESCAENDTDFAKTKRIRGSRFVAPTNAFQPRNTAAVKHRGYAKHLEKDYLFDDAAEMALVDELVFTRARALSVTATLKRMFTELEKTEDILARTALYGKMMQAETALDRNIARIESIERTLGTLDIIAVTPARIVADTEYRVAAREKVKAETQRLTAENKGVITPLTEAIDELQSLNKGGKL
ncbi:TPA_asm: terminase [Salmonella enterica subsp. houtenae serovar 45:g,z51:-]|uniref:Terminase n=1 Tax=Salmonella enterica subsp. houtenae serovar 45:g,z51:- TaxID=1967611 RepID=A0A736VI68_SALHO|nr:terminase [Salmonella enterica subsp. houtenae str. CFSAN000557]HAE7767737.1 terminase [Salmonella enterica subsp. houtenae serovar 45:g,z51:-]